MKRIFLIAALILLSCFTAQRLPNKTTEQNARDFITGFFNTLNGNFTLDANCIGKETKENIHDLIDAFHNKKVFRIIDDIRNITKMTLDTCPIDETKNYVETKVNAIKEGYYFENFKRNFLKIGEVVIHELNNKQKTAYSVGVACANIEKMTIFRQQNRHLAFLALEQTPEFIDFDMDLEGFKEFFKGVLEGVSSVPFEENVCYTSTIDIKIEEIKIIAEKLYNSIKNRDGSEFYNAILEVLKVLEKLQDANAHCNISGLIKSIGVYATPYVGIAKLLYNIASHYDLYWTDIKAAYNAFGNKEWQNAGSSIGKFASTLLGWETS